MSPGRRFINALIGTAERQQRIDTAKAAVLREMAAIDAELARGFFAEPLPPLMTSATVRWANRGEREFNEMRRAQAQRKRELHALLEDDAALLAWTEARAGRLSVAGAGGELSEVER